MCDSTSNYLRQKEEASNQADRLKGTGAVRTFETGATRDTDEGKLDYEGFISPRVLQGFAEYMHKHRFQSDGDMRDSDNWQKGMPYEEYLKSALRHFMDVWLYNRGEHDRAREPLEEALYALMFNVQGMLFELTREGDDATPVS